MTELAKVETPGGRRRTRRRKVILIGLLLLPAAGLLVSGASRAVSIRAYNIPSGSMAPTLKAGDRVGVQTKPSDLPKRGEVWVFRMPPAAGTPGEGVKRIIGLPGETVAVAGGVVLIDGVALSEPNIPGPISYEMPPRTLKPGEYFVLGDSRNSSHDGHVWGPLPADHLVGPVTMRYWPLRRVGGL